MTWQEIHGWFNFQQVYELAADRYPNGTFVEVGCWLGKSTAFLAELVPLVYAVDHWEWFDEGGERRKANFQHFLANMHACNVLHKIRPLRMHSTQAAKCFADESVDFVFLDALHERWSVSQDIKAWLPKVRNGGLLGGHDFDGLCPGVREAVVEQFGNDFQVIAGNSWIHFRKSNENKVISETVSSRNYR